MRPLLPILLLAISSACATTPPAPPGEVGNDIVLALAEGRSADAERLFERSAAHEDHSERIYPVLFEAARERYESGDYAGASGLLGFMAEHYPDSEAVHEARLYALFLQRATEEDPEPRLVDELEQGLEPVLASGDAPAWAHLVHTQCAIDRGELAEARTALKTFETRWDGEPAALTPYVVELVRYLETH